MRLRLAGVAQFSDPRVKDIREALFLMQVTLTRARDVTTPNTPVNVLL
jgi:hypothetical protein